MLLIPLLALGAACGSDTETPTASGSQCSYPASAQPASKEVDKPPGDLPKETPTEETIATDQGDVKVSFDADKAPCAVNSFVSLAKQGYFDGTSCHRLTTQGIFILQCGDPSAAGSGGPGYTFKDELIKQDARLQPCQVDASTGQDVCTYTTGTVAMANAGPETNGSQFFLVYKDSPLPAAFTVFGRMSAAGVKVVQDIAEGGLAADGVAPSTPVTITSVK